MISTDRLRGSRRSRGQSSTIGLVLLFGIVIAGAGIVVATGSTAITDTQGTSGTERASQELTLFDSRAAMVALGDAESQSVQFSNGDYSVNSSAGRIIVEVTNRTSGNVEEIYNGTVGTMLYRGDDVELAYQGGGVWRQDRNSGATMVSPPEFHFRRATLTLPVIKVINDDSAGGSTQARINAVGKLKRFYPNESATYSIGSGSRPYVNPIRAKNWTASVTVESEYAAGWHKYFEERTGGNATLIDEDTARVELQTIAGAPGSFPMPSEGNSLEVPGVADGHAITEFSVNVTSETGNSKDFVELPFSMYVDRGNTEFEIRISGDHNCGTGGLSPPYTYPSGDINVDVYYRNESTSPATHEEWTGTVDSADIIEAKCVDNKQAFANIELVSPSGTATNLTYKEIDDPSSVGNKKMRFASSVNSHSVTTSPTSFNTHSVDTGSYSVGGTESMGFVVDHYLSLLGPKYDLTVRDGPGGSSRVDESLSGGFLKYAEASGNQFLTYLHITENNVTIDVD